MCCLNEERLSETKILGLHICVFYYCMLLELVGYNETNFVTIGSVALRTVNTFVNS